MGEIATVLQFSARWHLRFSRVAESTAESSCSDVGDLKCLFQQESPGAFYTVGGPKDSINNTLIPLN